MLVNIKYIQQYLFFHLSPTKQHTHLNAKRPHGTTASRGGEPEPVGAGCFWLLGAGAGAA